VFPGEQSNQRVSAAMAFRSRRIFSATSTLVRGGRAGRHEVAGGIGGGGELGSSLMAACHGSSVRLGSISVRRSLSIALFLLISTVALQATQYAVLVGVSRYPAGNGKYDLDGPRYDVPALRDVLIRRYGFTPTNIEELVDEKATKANILAVLNKRVVAAQPGDRILFYFSGHGTSAFDQGMLLLASMIGPNSGALAPFDLQVSSVEAASQSMIIGHRDLRPILSRLNPAARAWVVLDACYSENAVRSLGPAWEGPPRAINLVSILKPIASPNGSTRQTAQIPGTGTTDAIAPLISSEPSEPYPYSNVISFSAASRDETARDISREMLRSGKYRTIDDRPHGAFTNGLLLALNGFADTNHDGNVTYDELFRSTRGFVEAESKQRPQLLPRAGDSLRQSALGGGAPMRPLTVHDSQTATGPPPKTRVALDGVDESLRHQIAEISGVEISESGFDLLVRRDNRNVGLHDHSRGLIREYSPAEIPQMLTRIAAQSDVARLLAFHFAEQNFNLSLDVDPVGPAGRPSPDFRAEFALGETIAISASSEKPAYLLVLNIDTSGVITVLYPMPKDAEPFDRADSHEILRAKVRRPTGSEFVKAFGFVQKPAEFEQFTCKATDHAVECPEIGPGDVRYQRLLTMLSSGTAGRSETQTKLLTRE